MCIKTNKEIVIGKEHPAQATFNPLRKRQARVARANIRAEKLSRLRTSQNMNTEKHFPERTIHSHPQQPEPSGGAASGAGPPPPHHSPKKDGLG
mmetsp:Transcript_7186/g.31786  ORF Transcript_7186/g.31786 Transcript_7186/m.31786 type:complete len:94 (+) Transcript_7186:2535-2816(+)